MSNSTAPLTTPSARPGRPPLLSLFFAFQIIGGHIGFPILLAVIFALRNATSRHPLFVNFCAIWIISSITFCILLYAGYDTGPEPPFDICVVQASLVYAMPIMAAVSLWALVFHLWLCLRRATSSSPGATIPQISYILVALPYVVGGIFIIFPAVLGATQPDVISRAQTDFGFHCSTDFHPLRTTVAATLALICVLVLVWEGLVGLIIYRNWIAIRKVQVYGWASANLFFRIALFTLYIILGIVACAIAIAFPSNRFRILFQASLPTAAWIFFGSRPDLYRRQPNSNIGSGSAPASRGSKPWEKSGFSSGSTAQTGSSTLRTHRKGGPSSSFSGANSGGLLSPVSAHVSHSQPSSHYPYQSMTSYGTVTADASGGNHPTTYTASEASTFIAAPTLPPSPSPIRSGGGGFNDIDGDIGAGYMAGRMGMVPLTDIRSGPAGKRVTIGPPVPPKDDTSTWGAPSRERRVEEGY